MWAAGSSKQLPCAVRHYSYEGMFCSRVMLEYMHKHVGHVVQAVASTYQCSADSIH